MIPAPGLAPTGHGPRFVRRPPRFGVWTVGAAVGIVLLLTGSASGGPTSTSPIGHWSAIRTHLHQVWYCAHQNSSAARFNLSTDNGSYSASGSAHSCPTKRGGAKDDSWAMSYENLSLAAPVTLVPTDHGVRVGWSISLAATTYAVEGLPWNGCPFYETNYTIPNASTTLYYSFDYQWCDVLAVVTVVAGAELVDLTTGKVLHSVNTWKGISLASGRQEITYGFFANYTNRSYWKDNYTTWEDLNYTFPVRSVMIGTFSPTFFVNGSFNPLHRYAIETFVNSSMAAESLAFYSGHAVASLNEATKGRHIDLVSAAVY